MKESGISIRYDKKTVKLLLVLLGVSAVVLGYGILNVKENGVTAYFIFLGAAAAIICGTVIFSAEMYFRRLRRYGYVIPKDKKEYESVLSNLLKEKDVSIKSYYAVYNKYGSYVCFLGFAICMVFDVLFYVKWRFMGEDALVVYYLCTALYFVWAIYGAILLKQSNKDVYRDDVEYDAMRKKRDTPEKIVLLIILMCVVSIYANASANSMTEYIFETSIESDMLEAGIIWDAVRLSIEDVEKTDTDLLQFESYNELCEGTVISFWEEPEDELQRTILYRLGKDSFSDLQNDFESCNLAAEVYVKIDDGNLTVRLLNPIEQIKKAHNHQEIIIDRSIYE